MQTGKIKDSPATNNFRQVVERATVEFPKMGGRGVFVGGNLILTASHCIVYETGGTMALDDHLIQEIQTFDGKNLKVQILAVDLVSDFAVLGAPDGQDFDIESKDFDAFCEATKPVPVCFKNYPRFAEFPVEIWTHKNIWVQGKATLNDPNTQRIAIQSESAIEPGTSGSAIVNEAGELIALVSTFSGNQSGGGWVGLNPFIPKALPVSIIQKIREHVVEQNED